jgi:hypothetical protein
MNTAQEKEQHVQWSYVVDSTNTSICCCYSHSSILVYVNGVTAYFKASLVGLFYITYMHVMHRNKVFFFFSVSEINVVG